MSEWFTDVFGGGQFSGVYRVLSEILLGAGSKYTEATSLVKTIYTNVMVPFAMALLVIYFVCSMIEKSTNEQFTYEQMFLLCAKMVVTVFLIDQGYEIMLKLQEVGLAFLSSFKNEATALGLSLSGGGEEYIENNSQLTMLYRKYTGESYPDDPDFWGVLTHLFPGIITLFIIWMLSFVVKICVYVVTFMRILEIFVRTMFAPVALSDMFYNGLNSTGFRFLKSYLAVSLQVVMIYGCIILYTVMLGDLAAFSGDAFLVKYLGLMAATVGLLFKSQSLIKEIVGTN